MVRLKPLLMGEVNFALKAILKLMRVHFACKTLEVAKSL